MFSQGSKIRNYSQLFLLLNYVFVLKPWYLLQMFRNWQPKGRIACYKNKLTHLLNNCGPFSRLVKCVHIYLLEIWNYSHLPHHRTKPHDIVVVQNIIWQQSKGGVTFISHSRVYNTTSQQGTGLLKKRSQVTMICYTLCKLRNPYLWLSMPVTTCTY